MRCPSNLLGSSLPPPSPLPSPPPPPLLAAYSYWGILNSAEEAVSIGKAKAKGAVTKVPGSEHIDSFFLFLFLKLCTIFSEIMWGSVYAVPVFAAWKVYQMVSATRQFFSGVGGGQQPAVSADSGSGVPVDEVRLEEKRSDATSNGWRSAPSLTVYLILTRMLIVLIAGCSEAKGGEGQEEANEEYAVMAINNNK